MRKILLLVFFVLFTLSFAFSETAQEQNPEEEGIYQIPWGLDLKYIAASLSVCAATIASGFAIGRIGSSAMGAVSEKPEAGGTAIILAALAEGVSLWGIAGAFLILLF